MSAIDFPTVVPKFDAILSRGLSHGLGSRDGLMCVEAAICAALDLPHGDNPPCVNPVVRAFKIKLNDKAWSSPQARAAGLRDLGIAQLGSRGVIDGRAFATRLSVRLIRVLLATLYREVFPQEPACLVAADRCEREGTAESARAAREVAQEVRQRLAAYAAASAADAAAAAAYADAAYAARSRARDKYLTLTATCALDVLRDLKSPGAVWLDAQRSA